MDTNGQNYQSIIEAHFPAYVAIPSAILCDARLKASEKILLALINLYGDYRPDYGGIQAIAGIGQKTAQGNLRHLDDLGYIHVVKNDGRGKTYRIGRGW